MKYPYYITFNHQQGSGAFLFRATNKIKTYEDVLNIGSLIEDKLKLENVVILNWKRIKG